MKRENVDRRSDVSKRLKAKPYLFCASAGTLMSDGHVQFLSFFTLNTHSVEFTVLSNRFDFVYLKSMNFPHTPPKRPCFISFLPIYPLEYISS
jgi:hypothetical protein